jgi:sulfur carrier protein
LFPPYINEIGVWIRVKISINGAEVILEKEITVEKLLNTQQVNMPQYVTVQINEEFISRDDFSELRVKDGDVVEFLYFMGGGSR